MATDRRDYIDWARGIAVLLMMEAHTIDAWTRAADRESAAYGYLIILGGFAAPLFLWLAGLGAVLSGARVASRASALGASASRVAVVVRIAGRGLEIFVLAFLFRLQAFIVSPGSHPVMIFRVDVLNVMGPSIVAAALLWPLADRPGSRAAVYAITAAAVGLATPIVRASPLVDTLPIWLQWYVRPAGELTTFTMFPWSGFVFAGAAVGSLLGSVPGPVPKDSRRLHAALAWSAGALIAAAWIASTRASIYSVPASFWTSSPSWFAMRVGIVMLAVSVLGLVPLRLNGPIARLGRASLFIYWIHVELVYGYASWFWRHRLPLWASAAGWICFSGLMFGVLVARDRYLGGRTLRFPRPAPAAQA